MAQTKRILGVLNTSLADREWLVGGKCTYADLAFFMWNEIIPLSFKMPAGETPLSEFPNVMRWHEKMSRRESVVKALRKRAELMGVFGWDEEKLRKAEGLEGMADRMAEKEAGVAKGE